MANPKAGQPHADPAWRWMGERGICLTTGETTLARYELLVSGSFGELEDIIPADGSILLIFRPAGQMSPGLREALSAPLSEATAVSSARHVIPVEFGGAAGPDLVALATGAGLTETGFINDLIAAEYTVAFLGFQPGFPYLAGLPPRLAAPRRATPRTHVAAGSVAIGGAYAGIYPADGPGGWNILGRTSTRLFDPTRASPALFRPGDRVRFVPAWT